MKKYTKYNNIIFLVVNNIQIYINNSYYSRLTLINVLYLLYDFYYIDRNV